MRFVGVRELKNRLTYYLNLIRGGDDVIVTNHGKPLALLHGVETIEETAGTEERLISLAGKGLVRLPKANARIAKGRPQQVKGKPVSEMIIEDRR